MEEISFQIKDINVIELEPNKVYNLVIIASNDVEAARLNDNLANGIILKYDYNPINYFFILKIYFIDKEQVSIFPIRINDSKKVVMSYIENHLINGIAIQYQKSNLQLISYGLRHPVTY